MKTFLELKNDVSVLCQRSGDSDYLAKIAVWLNLAHEFVYKIYDYWPQLQDVHNFSTVASTGDYFMPYRFDKPLRVFNLTSDKELTINTEEEYFSSNVSAIADSDTESDPSIYRFYGVSAVIRQIATTGGTVQVKSSSAADTNGAVIRVEGFLDSNLLVIGYENITVSTSAPTTAVAGAITFYKITHISKSLDTTGYITVEDSSANDLAYLEPTQRVAYHRIMKLGKIPSAVRSMRVLFKRTMQKMVNDNDYPFADMDEYLILEAYGYSLTQEKEGIERSSTIWNKSEKVLQNILQNVQNSLGPSHQHKMVSSMLQAHRFNR